MKFFDDLVTLFTRRPRGRAPTMSGEFVYDPATGGTRETGVIHRIPLYIRIFKPGQAEPIAVFPVVNIGIQDYAPAKIEGGRLMVDEKEAGVYFDCVTRPVSGDSVHVDKVNHVNGNKEEAPRKVAGFREKLPPNYAEAVAGI